MDMDPEAAISNASSEKTKVEEPETSNDATLQRPSDESNAQIQNGGPELMDAADAAPMPTISTQVKEEGAEPKAESEQTPHIAAEEEHVEEEHADEEHAEEEHPEWEIDSSPIESSSDDSSDDSSSEETDEEGENSYKFLSPEEQARILMLGDGGSDDEDGGNKGTKNAGSQLRTKNEIPEEVIPKPDVTITPEMPIEELGDVEAIVENTLLIKAKTSGEYRVLESGSVLCLADRSVIGAVAETLGRVQQPLYSVRFTNMGEITEAGLAVGTKVFYSEQHSTYVFTQSLKAYKGSDASNMHDEEVGEEEVEFSDDEAEMEHKRKLKQRKAEKRGGKMQHNGGSNRGGHPLRQEQKYSNAGTGLEYDDGEDEGPYKPLARPSGFADTVGRGEAPQEGTYSGENDRSNFASWNGDQFRGRGRGDRGRARGDQGRGGDRGRGRGGFHDRRGDNNGYSLPPQGHQNGYYPQPGGLFSQTPLPNFQAGYPHSQHAPPNPANFNSMPQNEYSPQQPLLWPQLPQPHPYQQPYQQAFQNMQGGMQGWPNMPSTAPLASGAFINPAFFNGMQPAGANQFNQQGQQRQQGNGDPPR
jgi:H/ACA ribonucleoprotein complex non-core subunit NAF1